MKTYRQIRMWIKFILSLLILLLGLAGFGISLARGAKLPSTTPQSNSPVTISGWITVVWGDGGPGGEGMPGPVYVLTEKNTAPVLVEVSKELEKSLGGAVAFAKKKVVVQGLWIRPPGQAKKTPLLKANAIQIQQGSGRTGAVNGPQPWVSILCKFADVTGEPNALPYFQGMYGSTYPGLNHYWQEQSYNISNVNGSGASGWFTLPQPKSYYVYDQNGDGQPDLDFGRALNDCTAAADPMVYFPSYVGINMMFNDNLDCCAWGGSGWVLTLDGVTQPWNLTWEPPWGYQNAGVIAHEMGHGFGLPHSSGKYGQVYDNQWDVLSDIWTNCYLSTDPVYGCLGQHTISPYKNQLDWISPELRFTATAATTPATITLEQLALPQTGNYRMAIIPIQNSPTHYYTVEVRRWAGYDVKLPGQGVIIHEVIDGYAYVLDVDNNGNTGDEGAIWRPGETFSDPANQITVTINSETISGATLTVRNEFTGNLIFRDGFESCDLSAWSPNVIDGGDLSATSAAAIVGNCGMQAVIDDNVSLYVASDHPDAETRYIASFYFDPNSISMTSGDTHLIFGGYTGTSTLVARVQFRKYSGNYQLQASLLNDSSTWTATSWTTISDAPHQIKLDWQAASGAGANNGSLTFWIDGTQLPVLSGVDNDTRRIVQARLGAANGIDSGTRGTEYFDEFESYRGDIGGQDSLLSINKTGTGRGTVTSSPPGIDCGSDCSERYPPDTPVTLTATLDPGSSFTGWSGVDCPGTGVCTITLTADTTVTAAFEDIAVPSIVWTSPVSDGQVYDVGNETTTLEVSASDNIGISEVIFTRWDYVNLQTIEIGRVSSAPYRINFDTSVLLPGWNEIDAVALDAAGMGAGSYIWLNHVSAPSTIFKDGFESGDFSKWSSCTVDGGDLSVTSDAKYTGTYGMQAAIDDNVAIYCTSEHPNAETRYLASFYFDPNSITMTSGDTHLIFGGYSGTSTLVARVQFRKYSGNYQVQASLLNDGSTWKSTSWYTITDAYHQLKLDWKAATAAGSNNGDLTFWVDDTQLPTLTGVDNDTRRIDRARLGAVNGIDNGTRGSYYFDDFDSSRSDGTSESFVLTANKTGTGSGRVASDPAGIDCGSDCSERYASGTVITLTAAPDPGSSFTGWSGVDCPGTGVCTITLTADTTITANFILSPSQPDLIIESITTVPANPPKFQPVIFNVVIKNQGTADAGSFYVDLFADSSVPNDCTGTGFLHSSVSSLAAGASQTLTLDFWEGFGSAGDRVVNGAIDTRCDVSESNENNNTKSVVVKVDEISQLFNDGFETGDFSRWSSCTTDGGDLSVRPNAYYLGNYGMQAVIDDNVAIYCTSDHPAAETRYLARFSFDPNSITMTNGDTHPIFGGYSGTSTLVLRVQFRKYSGNYQVQASLLNDGSTWKATDWITITDGYHEFQLYWKAASAVGANDGGLSFWIDEKVTADLTGVDNDTRRIDRALLGAVNGLDTGTRGTYYFDEFVSLRGGGGTEPTATLTVNKTGTGSGIVNSNPAGIDCGSDCSETYPSGTQVILTAAPISGSQFTSWNGGGCGGNDTCTVTLTADTTVTANFDLITSPDLIFADGFESGDLSAWSPNATDTGDLSVTTNAAMKGIWGMQALIDDTNAIYVNDEAPIAEPRYRARFYFDPNSITMASGDAHILFRGISGSSTVAIRLELSFSGGSYQLRAALVNDGTTWTQTNWFPLSDLPHYIELDWRAATAAGANNGGLTLWIDGLQKQDLTGIDNDTRRIDRVLLGAVSGIDTGTRGIYYFDAFESHRQNYIGP